LVREPGFRRLLIINWLMASCWDVHTFVVPVIGHERELSASTIGSLLGAFSIAAMAVRIVLPMIAGRVTEQSIGGCAFIRVDVPAQPARPATQTWDSDDPFIPAYTRYLSSSAIYAINPCSEELAKVAAERMRSRPAIPFARPPSLPAPAARSTASSTCRRCACTACW
jgi:hypothetical protein